jgi:CRISPR system Cascade subunit CasA
LQLPEPNIDAGRGLLEIVKRNTQVDVTVWLIRSQAKRSPNQTNYDHAKHKPRKGVIMTKENRFNLIDEPWIPIAGIGRVSLMQIFIHSEYRALGGNPVQKIALTKLLLAIAQSAYTPKNNDDWVALGAEGLAQKCLQYLQKWHDKFYLYGDKPFLQMPILDQLIKNDKPVPFGPGFYPDVVPDNNNNTILTQTQIGKILSDAEKALFIITLMNFALGGKRIHKKIPPLTINYQGKTDSAKSAPSLGNYVGYLHSYLIGESLQETIWLNLYTLKNIQDTKTWKNGLGIAPWEEMPSGESCETAIRLKTSYMGCLLSMSRFVLLKDEGIFYIEGIQYPSHKDGWFEPSISLNHEGDFPKPLWLDVNKKPWRELTSLLSFLATVNQQGFDCHQIRLGFQKVKLRDISVGIWSGGLKVRGTSGDQSVKQDDDFIESNVQLNTINLGDKWFSNLKQEMDELDKLSKIVYSATLSYFKYQNMEAKDHAAQANNLFWQLCEKQFQILLDVCPYDDQVRAMRPRFARFVEKSYNTYCSNDTARQLDAWAKNRPNLAKYLYIPNKETV